MLDASVVVVDVFEDIIGLVNVFSKVVVVDDALEDPVMVVDVFEGVIELVDAFSNWVRGVSEGGWRGRRRLGKIDRPISNWV